MLYNILFSVPGFYYPPLSIRMLENFVSFIKLIIKVLLTMKYGFEITFILRAEAVNCFLC